MCVMTRLRDPFAHVIGFLKFMSKLYRARGQVSLRALQLVRSDRLYKATRDAVNIHCM